MTNEEFAALNRLLPGPPGRAREAARRVLVEGAVPNAAATGVGVSLSAVTRLVARLRKLDRYGCPTCGRPAGG